MLRITIDENPESVTLRLEGKLIGLWVEEVEQCWRKVFATLGPRMVLVDLSAVDFVDRAGRLLLACMETAGFRIEGGGLMKEYLVERVCQDSSRLN